MFVHGRVFIDVISIHALRKESDSAGSLSPYKFSISIHALRKESDWSCGRRFRR